MSAPVMPVRICLLVYMLALELQNLLDMCLTVGLWLHVGILRHVSYFSVCPVIVVACMMHFSLLCLVDLPVWHEPFVCLPWRFSCQNMSIDMDCIPAGVLFVRLFLTEFVGLHCSAAFACEFDVFSCGTLTRYNVTLSPDVTSCL